MMDTLTEREHTLYLEAIFDALNALLKHAVTRGQGWYHYDAGELIIGVCVNLKGARSP